MHIKGVAVLVNRKMVTMDAPARHHNILHQLDPHTQGPIEEGFVTRCGRFLDRKSAYIVATTNGQFKRHPTEGYQGDKLFSEDLW